MSIIAPLFNYPSEFHQITVDEIDYLVTQLIARKRTYRPGYYFPNDISDIQAKDKLRIPGIPEGTECEHQVLSTGTGRRSLREGDYFCFFQDTTLTGEHNAYCDVIGLWQVVTNFFETVYEGVGPFKDPSQIPNQMEVREFVATRLLLHELL